MKKITMYITSTIMALGLLMTTGCLNPTGNNKVLIDTGALVLHQASYQGATYAIQQNVDNTKWFLLADTTIKKFATGKDLTPRAFEKQLVSLDPALQNQWIQLAIDSTLVIYDGLYSDYVISQVNSNAIALQFLTAITDGFDEALGLTSTPTTLKLKAVNAEKVEKPTVIRPSVVKK